MHVAAVARQLLVPSLSAAVSAVLETVLLSAQLHSDRAMFHALVLAPDLHRFFERVALLLASPPSLLPASATTDGEAAEAAQLAMAVSLMVAGPEAVTVSHAEWTVLRASARRVARLCYAAMQLHSGYPELYSPLLHCIRPIWVRSSRSIASLDLFLSLSV